MLAGAESVLARVWHEHTKTKAYTPISFGEILQKLLFTASGDVNLLTLPRQGSSTAAGQALRLVNGEVVSVEDPQWAPRSLLAIIDGVDAARWALILVEVGKEEDINAFADWFVAKARGNPTKLDQVKRLWLKASWAVALGTRAGKTFKEGRRGRGRHGDGERGHGVRRAGAQAQPRQQQHQRRRLPAQRAAPRPRQRSRRKPPIQAQDL